MTPHAELLLHLTFRHRDGWWVLDCEEMPGLYIAHADAHKVMADFIPAWQKLNELDGDGPEQPALAAPTVEGWKWVPVPSREMLLAGLIAMHHCKVGTPFSAFAVSETREVENIYRAMLAAISSAPQQASETVGPAIVPTEEAANAFWKYWRENGETHKHGYYESTWGAINVALRTSGVVMHDYLKPLPADPANASGEPHPEDSCQECGRPNVVWFAPSPIWNAACGDSPGILCPVCFIKKAQAVGFDKDAWLIQPEFYGAHS